MDTSQSIYIALARFTTVEPFKKSFSIQFTIWDGVKNLMYPSQWTILLGNNNTGKTTILRKIAILLSSEKYKKNDFIRTWTEDYLNKMAHEKSLPYKEVIKDFFENNDKYRDELLPIINDDIKKYGSVIGGMMWRDEVTDQIKEGHYFIDSNYFKETDKKVREKKIKEDRITFDYCHYLSVNGSNNVPFVVGYGVNRRPSQGSLSNIKHNNFTESLISNQSDLVDLQEWLMQIDYAHKNGLVEASKQLEKIQHILTSGILPDVKDFRQVSTFTKNGIQNSIEILTDYGWSGLNKLGYGYQSLISWLIDLVKKFFDYYPDSTDPLSMPAIVLVDEIDLHLHPKWQRNIISYLSKLFPNTQFIVSTHSPLIIQSAEEINLVLLKKVGDHVEVSQPEIPTFKGWSVEEILSEMMDMEEETFSDTYLELMKKFDEALEFDDYEAANDAYNKLDAILHPESNQRKLLRIQMASLTPAS